MKKSTSFPSELYEANSEMGPNEGHPVPECTPEFQQQLQVYRETNLLCSKLGSMNLSSSGDQPNEIPVPATPPSVQAVSPVPFWQQEQPMKATSNTNSAFFVPTANMAANGSNLSNDYAGRTGSGEALNGIGMKVEPRSSTERMFSTTPGCTDEDMSDEVCFLMNHVEVSGHDVTSPSPEGPIMPYIL